MHSRPGRVPAYAEVRRNSRWIPGARRCCHLIRRAMIYRVMSMRAFFCLCLDSQSRNQIASVADALAEAVSQRPRVAWVRPANYHITLRFLGEIDPMSTVRLEEAARQAASEIRPFTVSLDRLGCFPTPERPRVLWVGGPAADPFAMLRDALDAELQSLGWPSERPDPLVHVTLGRVKSGRFGNVERELAGLKMPRIEQRIGGLTLMESRLSARGAQYEPLLEVRFRSADGSHAV